LEDAYVSFDPYAAEQRPLCVGSKCHFCERAVIRLFHAARSRSKGKERKRKREREEQWETRVINKNIVL
jgi:hypothetical protein